MKIKCIPKLLSIILKFDFSFVENYVINVKMGHLELTYLRGAPVIVNNG
jgi:hypothetical protein